LSALHCDAAENCSEDEIEECNQSPSEYNRASSTAMSNLHENEQLCSSKMLQSFQVNRVLTNLEPNEDTIVVNKPHISGSTTSGNRGNMLSNVKDFSDFQHSCKRVKEFQVKKVISVDIEKPNRRATVARKPHLVVINTSLGSSRSGGYFSKRHQNQLTQPSTKVQSFEVTKLLTADTIKCSGQRNLVNEHDFIESNTGEGSCTSGNRASMLVGAKNFSNLHQSEFRHSSKIDQGFQTKELLTVDVEKPSTLANFVKKRHLIVINTSVGSSTNISTENMLSSGKDSSSRHQNEVPHSKGVQILKVKKVLTGEDVEQNGHPSVVNKHFVGPGTYRGSAANGNVMNTCHGLEMRCSVGVSDKYQCRVCDVKFSCPSHLRKHMRVHPGEKPYKCTFCDGKFQTESALKMHDLRHKGLLPQCRVCGGRYVSLSAHMKIHSTDNFKHVCSVCNKAFRKPYSLKKHMMVHSDERPYTCADCGGRFRTSAHLKLHMVTHTKEKNEMCTVCGKTFALKGSLRIHMRIHSGEKPYCCETCGRAYRTSGLLAAHQSAHTSEKAFVCITCGKQFRRDSQLWRHKLIHSGKQPYECSLCGMKFNQSNSMKRHMLIHTGEKPYSCSDCGERFTQSGGLASHRRRHCPNIKDQ